MNLQTSIKLFNKMIDPLRRRVMLMVGRAVITAIKDSEGIQSLQLSALADETLDEVERFQQYGFTAHPYPKAEALVVFPSGNRDHGVVIAVDDRRYRLKGLSQGEVAMYTDEGDSIVIKRGGNIEVNASSEVSVTAPVAKILSDDVEIGNGTLEKVFKSETFQAFFNSHTHISNIPGNATSTPQNPSIPAHLSTIVKTGS